jgi:glycosyltransferase involved in cell wall biosynthesis
MIFLGTQMEVGGSQKNLLAHAQWFHEKGHKVAAVFFYDKQDLHQIWQQQHSFPIIDLGAWQLRGNPVVNLFLLVKGIFSLYTLLRKDVELIETFTPDSNLIGLPIAWIANVPVRIATHRARIGGRPFFYPRLHGLLINSKLADILLAVSNRIEEFAVLTERVDHEKIKVILNGVELPAPDQISETARVWIREEIGVRENQPVVLSVGRFKMQKGHTYLLQAIPKVLKDLPETHFVFAGDGPLRAELEQEADQLGIKHAVHFLGIRNDVPDLLAAADVFVLPSLWEGMSMAMLEAMAAGVAVVVTDVEGIDNVIQNQEEGLVVPSRSPRALAKALLRVLKDEGLREKLGAAARKKIAADFSLEEMCQQYERVFMELLSKKGILP